MHEALPDSVQRTYARLAGVMCLSNYAVNVFGVLTPSKIKGAGDFAEVAQRVIASEHLYRAALTSMTIGWVVIVILSFALYVTLEPVNKRLAGLALFFRLGEAFVGGATVIWSFATLRLYTAAQGAAPFRNEQLQALLSVTGSATDVASSSRGLSSARARSSSSICSTNPGTSRERSPRWACSGRS